MDELWLREFDGVIWFVAYDDAKEVLDISLVGDVELYGLDICHD